MKYELTIDRTTLIVEKRGGELRLLSDDGSEWCSWKSEKRGSDFPVIRSGDFFFTKVGDRHVSGKFRSVHPSVDRGFNGTIVSPFSGRVAKIFVNAGESVLVDAPLLIVEAMKMEYPIIAPKAGVISSLSVEVGDQVAMGEVVAMIKVG